MTDLLYLDFETHSPTPISAGSYRYAEESEIMVVSWAFGDETEQVCDLTADPFPRDVLDAIRDPGVTIVGHNFGNFDRVICRQHGLVIPPERIHDTMIQALSHGLPGSLERLGEIFGISEDEAKLKTGKALIREFCVPRPKTSILRRHTRETHPEKWADFLAYAKQDIPAMRFIYKEMPRWNYPGEGQGNMLHPEYALWCLDQRINERGLQVDVELAEAAIKAVDIAKKELDARTVELTDDEVQRAAQRDKLIRHVLDEYNITLPDMTKSTLERRLNDPDLPDAVRELLAIRLESTTTSNSKYAALLKSVCKDGRLRGTMQFRGASRTGRWSGRVFQPQNLPRTPEAYTPAEQERGIAALKRGIAHVLYDSPIAEASKAIRGCIVAAEGKKLAIADLSQIEARVLPWLAGAQWKLDAFRKYDEGTGPDLYRVEAAAVLGIPLDEITKDQRQRYGKVPTLSSGYGGSIGAFNAMAVSLGGEIIPDAEAKRIVDAWRAANPEIADWDTGFWTQLDEAARRAIAQPDRAFAAGEHITFERWRNWLRMTKPSGDTLCYASPEIVPDPRWKGKMAISYWGLNPYSRRWERRFTYGGKLAADATQSVARDVIAHNLPAIEDEGFPVVLLVHDEVVTEPLDSNKLTVDRLVQLISRRPDWADERLPLSADGFEAKRYRK